MSVRESAGSVAPDRRSSGERVQFEALVAVGETAGGGFEAESIDVSPDGMRLRTAFLPNVGEKLVCRFDGMGHEVVADGEVIWRKEATRGGEFGLRFTGLDATTEETMRTLCASLASTHDEPAASEPRVPRGSRVRLHIEGLGSPMKARVRDSAPRELEVGSNLEFLKVGRALELEDVELGKKREVMIDSVKVDVDPSTNVPQLVVSLRYDKSAKADQADKGTKTPDKADEAKSDKASAKADKVAAAPAKKREKAATPSGLPRRPSPSICSEANEAKPDVTTTPTAAADDNDEGDGAQRFGERALSAGRAVADKLGPTLAGMSARAKGAMAGVAALVERKRNERAEAKKTGGTRRTTAPPPSGALTASGRRLVRDDGTSEEADVSVPPRTSRRSAAIGGAVGLSAVLVIFGVTRFMGSPTPAPVGDVHAEALASASASASSAPLAVSTLPLAAPELLAAAGSATPVANVPLFGATPMSTIEAVPAGPAPSASAPAADSGSPTPAPPPDSASADDDDSTDNHGPILKEWGKGDVGAHPVVLKIKMDGAIERIRGAAGAQGFTISVPDRRSVSSMTDLTRKDKRLSSVNVVNTSHGAEVSVEFKDGVPSYQARAKGERLEIAIGKEAHAKVAKSKKGGKKKKH